MHEPLRADLLRADLRNMAGRVERKAIGGLSPGLVLQTVLRVQATQAKDALRMTRT